MVALADGIDVEIEPDPGSGASQWFHFAVEAPAGTRVRIVNADASTYPSGWPSSLVWWRSAARKWRALRPRFEDAMVQWNHPEPGGATSYALFPPYPAHRLAALARRVAGRPGAAAIAADPARGGAPRLVLGDGSPSARQIWIVCGQHGNEHPALWFAEGFVEGLLARPVLPDGVRFHVVPLANPTGWAAGHLRANAAGQDPNRLWDRPGTCREVGTLVDAMTGGGIDLLLDVHTDFEMGCVYLDVLDAWMATPSPLVAVRERFERGLSTASTDLAYGRRYPWQTAPRPELLAGMCAPAIERRFGVAALTLELPIGLYRNARGDEDVWSPQRSEALGRAAAAVLMADR
ncbi:MAG: hypothetical protein KF914_03305 [Rhizobiaceae bacterium]|nr:hypothetical protein [Rhizobiaceae bacterium]